MAKEHIKETITREKLIKAYIDFFKSKKHKHIPSSSLIPENDPTVLFTTAGMHPLVPYLLGEKHPIGKRLVNIQKCIRTSDIDEVGDEVHHTFFEMLGNWSLGDYFKKEAIGWSFELATKILGLDKSRIAVSVFAGNKNAPKDEESAKIWISLGISKEKIAFLPKDKNWWEHPSNNTPCGPCTELFYWKNNKEKTPKNFNPEDENWVEIWNDVLMQYTKIVPEKYILAKQNNIDNGRGLERILAVVNNYDDNYLTEIWQPIIKEIENLSGKSYKSNGENKKAMRIIADHIKAATFILGDPRAIKPSNMGQGYVLRRLIRRAIRYGKIIGIKDNFTSKIAKTILPIYPDYQELADEKNIKIDLDEYNKEFERHQDLSRTSSGGQFKSGLADNSEQTKKLHTATHLLNEALRKVLKDKNIRQKGSNINPERLRFDFNFPRKLEEKEIKAIEEWVNDKINKKIQVKKEELPLKSALEAGAQAEFGTKYPELVSVYSIPGISIEICTGPHALNTGELGKFKIIKEESSAAGIRRIKAVLE